MKKIICILYSVSIAVCALTAAERTVWEGNKAISWNTEVYAGEQFETPEGTFIGLVKDDTIKVTVIAQLDEPQYVMTYKDGDQWTWTDLTDVTVENSIMTYIVPTEQMATWIAERGLVFRGQGYDMTKIVVASIDTIPDPIDPVDPDTLQPGEIKVLWEGTETLAWNEVAEQPASVGALLAENDQIIVSVSAKGAAEWPKVLLRDLSSTQVGEDILLNEVTEFPYEAVFNLSASDVIALQNGFRLCGDGVTVTKMVLKKYEEPEPEPVDPAEEYVFTTVWTGDKAISWNTEIYAGEQFDTYATQQDMFAGLAKDDSIKVFYAQAIEDAQFAVSYKAGEDWTWTDLAITEHVGFYAYKVASDEMAQLIADRGIVLRGQGYHATSIAIGKPKSTTGIEPLTANPSTLTVKILRNGQVLIVRDGAIYNMLGQQIK